MAVQRRGDIVECTVERGAPIQAITKRATCQLDEQRPRTKPTHQPTERRRIRRIRLQTYSEQFDSLGFHHLVHPNPGTFIVRRMPGNVELASRDQACALVASLEEPLEVPAIPHVIDHDQHPSVAQQIRNVTRRVVHADSLAGFTRQRAVHLGQFAANPIVLAAQRHPHHAIVERRKHLVVMAYRRGQRGLPIPTRTLQRHRHRNRVQMPIKQQFFHRVQFTAPLHITPRQPRRHIRYPVHPTRTLQIIEERVPLLRHRIEVLHGHPLRHRIKVQVGTRLHWEHAHTLLTRISPLPGRCHRRDRPRGHH